MSRGLGEKEILLGEVLTDVFSFMHIALVSYSTFSLPFDCSIQLLSHRSTNTRKTA